MGLPVSKPWGKIFHEKPPNSAVPGPGRLGQLSSWLPRIDQHLILADADLNNMTLRTENTHGLAGSVTESGIDTGPRLFTLYSGLNKQAAGQTSVSSLLTSSGQWVRASTCLFCWRRFHLPPSAYPVQTCCDLAPCWMASHHRPVIQPYQVSAGWVWK